MSKPPEKLPRYRDLPARAGNPAHTAWGLFGDQDNVGMFNLQTPERITAAAKLVKKGAIFTMNWEQELPNPPLFNRGHFRHTVSRDIPVGHHGDDVLRHAEQDAQPLEVLLVELRLERLLDGRVRRDPGSL